MSDLVPIPRRWTWLLLISVAICAACGLIYELALLTLSTSVNGGSVVETSLIVAGYVAALGLGALAAKPFLDRPASTFLLVEAALGLVGGTSALVMYEVFVSAGNATAITVGLTIAIGLLVGAEVPLLMTLIQAGRVTDARGTGSLLSTLNFADYLGALIGGLAWPFLLLPVLGMVRGTLAAGFVNIAAALFAALVLLNGSLPRRWLRGCVAALLGAGVVLAGLVVVSPSLTNAAQQRLYADPIIYSQQSDYQSIVVTQRGHDRRLFLDGGLQYSTRDEYRYTEALVYPAITAETSSVLIIGGGDGLAARELVRMDIDVTMVELDPLMIDVASTLLREDNAGALQDPRVTVIIDDALTWLREHSGHSGQGRFDAVIVDLPDPDSPVLARLYSQEFYTLARQQLTPKGRMVVQSSSPFATPKVYSRIVSTVAAAGCAQTTPYHVHVPTFGDWGFTLCAPAGTPLDVPERAGSLHFLDDATLAAAGVFGRDNVPKVVEPSTIIEPRILDDVRAGYRDA
ncbi:polyamine aminopropyltransferase [Corynebacterium uterequi]|uniref:Polyamine aminopropyltransferase n=1 Tax=Corynebacterium uterequi TaxID=1072256 RepID=A0A0G3HKS4_9CORY|nr:polyamine aminopropyltransferase [Corynebacterium uterequi]AKK11697.1 putative spermidine synthase with an N-terminal membrane domain [Corynebacterium uterequi]